MSQAAVQELRLVVTVDDLGEALALYRDALGMPELQRFAGPGHVVLLDAGRATIELTDVAHAAHIDEVEIGHVIDGRIRVALRVDDVDTATDRVLGLGTPQLSRVRPSPWGSHNSRFQLADDLQLTLFADGTQTDLDPKPDPSGCGS